MRKVIFLIPLIATVITGCVPSQRATFNPELKPQIKKIGLLSITSPVEYENIDFAGDEATQGFLGGGIFGGMITGKNRLAEFKK